MRLSLSVSALSPNLGIYVQLPWSLFSSGLSEGKANTVALQIPSVDLEVGHLPSHWGRCFVVAAFVPVQGASMDRRHLQWHHMHLLWSWSACPQRIHLLCQEKFRYCWYWPRTTSFSSCLSVVRLEITHISMPPSFPICFLQPHN